MAGGDELQDQGGEGFGEEDRLAAEPEPYLVAAGLDVAEGEPADRGRPLGVEQDEQPGDAVFGFEGAVVQQPAGLFPAGLGVDHAGRAAPSDGGEVQAGQLRACVAQRTKCPASARWVACALASQVSRSPCRAVARVRSRAVSQSSSAIAAVDVPLGGE